MSELVQEIIKLREERDDLLAALEKIREVWAGAEAGEPVHAQEAYAIHLCKQMYQIAVTAIVKCKGE